MTTAQLVEAALQVLMPTKSRPAPAAEIIEEVRRRYGASLGGGYALRSVLHELRTSGRVPLLLAGTGGYFFASSRDEVFEYLGELEAREEQIRHLRLAIFKQAEERFPAATRQLDLLQELTEAE